MPPSPLSRPDRSPAGISRRRFLQGALALGGVTALRPSWVLGDRAEAAPLGPDERILVLVYMGGGNDGLNTVGPFDDGTYRSLRGALAIDPATAHPVGEGLYLHPALSGLKTRFDAGQVAVVRGIGDAADDHSHFNSVATWMSARTSGAPTTGWLGRHLDGAGLGGLGGIAIGDGGIPLTLVGQTSTATGLPTQHGLFGANTGQAHDTAMYAALAAMGQDAHTKGPWAQAMADAVGDGIGMANQLNTAYAGTLPEDDITRSLLVAARIINLDVGARVLTTSFGSFDTHDDQLVEHAGLLGAFDAAVDTFFATLTPALASRVTLMTFSEFGRRVQANSSRGTDHGAAGLSFVIGPSVRGGLHGAQPSLTALDARGDLQHSVDFRSLYATVLGDWLGGDDTAVLGGTYEHLPIFSGGGGGGPTPPAGGFQAIGPVRILDTRTGLGGGGGKVVAGTPRMLTLTGAGGLPASGVGAVVLNLTATEPSASTYVTAWPKGSTMPLASNLNVGAGQTRPNAVIAKVGNDGAVALAVGHGSAHLIADVVGWFPATGSCFTALTPARALDTRTTGGKIGTGATRSLSLRGVGGVPSAGAGAVVLNVTATEPTANTYLTVYPSGTTRPTASNLNPAAGDTVANLVIATLGADGSVTIYNHAGSTHVVADILGWIPAGDARYTALTPARLLDTRTGLGTAAAAVGAGQSVDLVVAGRGSVPLTGARAVVLNVTATEPSTATFVTVWPSDAAKPSTSNLNSPAGATVANLVVATIGANGRVRLGNANGTIHLIADVLGWFA